MTAPVPNTSTVGTRPASIVAALSMLGSVAVAWLPWVRSGEALRNSYEALRSAQRLGLDQLTPFRVVWFVLPVVALAALVAALAGRPRVFGGLSVFVGVVLVAAGIVVMTSAVDAAVGAWLAVAVGVVATGAGGILIWQPQAARGI